MHPRFHECVYFCMYVCVYVSVYMYDIWNMKVEMKLSGERKSRWRKERIGCVNMEIWSKYSIHLNEHILMKFCTLYNEWISIKCIIWVVLSLYSWGAGQCIYSYPKKIRGKIEKRMEGERDRGLFCSVWQFPRYKLSQRCHVSNNQWSIIVCSFEENTHMTAIAR